MNVKQHPSIHLKIKYRDGDTTIRYMYWIYESYITWNIWHNRISYILNIRLIFLTTWILSEGFILLIQVRFLVGVGVSYILCLEPINPLGLSTMVSFRAEQGEPKVRGERGEGHHHHHPSPSHHLSHHLAIIMKLGSVRKTPELTNWTPARSETDME